MAVLTTQALDSLRFALPHFVIPAVIRCLPAYLLPVGALLTAQMVVHYGAAAAESYGLVAWFAVSAISFYGFVVQARLIGLLYRRHSVDLGWDQAMGVT